MYKDYAQEVLKSVSLCIITSKVLQQFSDWLFVGPANDHLWNRIPNPPKLKSMYFLKVHGGQIIDRYASRHGLSHLES